ncbi:MAG TPA: two-component regulator propeller domain-containing protein [Flavobacteriales bacterium]
MHPLRSPLLALLILPALVPAQGPSLPGSAVQVPVSGLPPGNINALLTDAQGLLWMGTDNGLCRFDGINLDLYRNIPGDSTSIMGNSIRSLHCDRRQQLWVGGMGLCRYDRKGDHFQRIPVRTAEGDRYHYECLDIEEDAEGGLWAAGIGLGLMRYDTAHRCLRSVVPNGPDGPLTSTFTSSIVVDDEGALWTTDHTSIVRYDPRTERGERYGFLPNGERAPRKTLFTKLRLVEDDPDGIWIGGWGLGLVRFDRRRHVFEGPYLWQSGEPSLTNLVHELIGHGHHGILTATGEGIRRFDRDRRTWSEPLSWSGMDPKEAFRPVFALRKEPDGLIWTGTYTLGVIPANTGRYTDLGGGSAMRVLRDPEGDGYWMTRFYSDRSLIHTDSRGRIDLELPLPGAATEKYEPFSLARTSTGDVLIGTTQGALRYHPGTRTFEHLRTPGRRVGPEGRSYVTSFIEMPQGTVWIGTAGDGIWRFDLATDSIHPVPASLLSNKGRMYWGTLVAPLDSNHLLMTFQQMGLGVFDRRTGRIATLTADHPNAAMVDDVVGATAAGHGIVHVGTRTNGILELQWNGPERTGDPFTVLGAYRPDDQREVFTDILADDRGITWIASTSGLVRFDRKDHRFTRQGPREGFPFAALSGLYADAPGSMVAQADHLVRFDTRQEPLPPRTPHLYLRTLLANGDALPTPTDTAGLRLPHHRNTLSIAYAPISILHAADLRYEVRLIGRDPAWVNNGDARTVTYVDLPPGEYRFAVRIKGSETPALECPITIVPAYWQTWWFRLLTGIAILAAVFLLSRYIIVLRYRRRIAELQREQEVQRTRMRIARDIHDGIGGGLTRIALLSRRIPGQGPDSAAARITEASTELVRELGEIVWTVDPGNDARSAFLAFVRSTLGRQFDDLDIRLEQDLHVEEAEGALPLPPDAKRNTLLILKEAVNNALKHAQAKTISVRLHLIGSRLELEVKDDGRGFDTAMKAQAGNGLANFRKRAEAAGGTLTVHSAPGEGTSIRFTTESLPTFM